MTITNATRNPDKAVSNVEILKGTKISLYQVSSTAYRLSASQWPLYPFQAYNALASINAYKG